MKPLLRASLVPFLALSAVGVPALPAAADIDTDQVMRSTVWVDSFWIGQVDVSYTDNTSQRFTATAGKGCTGFIVSGAGDIATAGHCVQYDDAVRKALLQTVINENNLAPTSGQFDLDKLTWPVSVESTPTIQIGQPSIVKDAPFDKDGITARLVAAQDPEAGDNALVQVVGKDTAGTVLPIAEQAPKVRDHITAVGFPSDTASITEATRQSPTFKEGSISAQTVSKKGVPKLQLDGELISGMSGGPTLNSAGQVVGVNSSGFTNRNESFVTDTATLRTFLEQNGVKLTAAAGASASSGSNAAAAQPAAPQAASSSDSTLTTTLIVALCVLALLVVAGAGYLFLQRRKPAPAAAAASAPSLPLNDPDHGPAS
jgi:S1-C subfamily serine protease